MDASVDIKIDEQATETATWNLTADEPDGEWWKSVGKSDKSFHIFGDLDGGVVELNGSGDKRCVTDKANAAFFKIRDPDRNLIAVSSVSDDYNADIIFINPVYMRPRLVGAGPNANVYVVVTGAYVR